MRLQENHFYVVKAERYTDMDINHTDHHLHPHAWLPWCSYVHVINISGEPFERFWINCNPKPCMEQQEAFLHMTYYQNNIPWLTG